MLNLSLYRIEYKDVRQVCFHLLIEVIRNEGGYDCFVKKGVWI